MPKDAGKPPPGTGRSSPEQLFQRLRELSKLPSDLLIEHGLSLDEDAATELLRQADERIKAWMQVIAGLEQKIHIMMGFNIVVLGLVLGTDVAAEMGGGWRPSGYFWPVLLSLLAAAAFCSLACLSWGLFGYTQITVYGDHPDGWDVEHLDARHLMP